MAAVPLRPARHLRPCRPPGRGRRSALGPHPGHGQYRQRVGHRPRARPGRQPGGGAVVDVRSPSRPSTAGTSASRSTPSAIEETLDYYSQTPIALPIGIAEVGIPGAPAAAPLPTDVPTGVSERPAVGRRRPGVGPGDRHRRRTPSTASRSPSSCADPTPAASPSARVTTPCARRSARASATTSTRWRSTRLPVARPATGRPDDPGRTAGGRRRPSRSSTPRRRPRST